MRSEYSVKECARKTPHNQRMYFATATPQSCVGTAFEFGYAAVSCNNDRLSTDVRAIEPCVTRDVLVDWQDTERTQQSVYNVTIATCFDIATSSSGWIYNILTFSRLMTYIYSCRTAMLTSRCCILYIYSTNIRTEYFKHAAHSPFFPLQNAVYFIMLPFLVPVLFTF